VRAVDIYMIAMMLVMN